MLPTRRIRSTQTQWTMHAQKTYALSSDAASRSASQAKGTSSACIRTPSGGGAAPLLCLCVAETVVESPGAPGRAIWTQWGQMDKGGSRHSCSILLPSSLWAGQCRRAAAL